MLSRKSQSLHLGVHNMAGYTEYVTIAQSQIAVSPRSIPIYQLSSLTRVTIAQSQIAVSPLLLRFDQ